MSREYGPCLCGATDCPSCGPAQGYPVVRKWNAKLQRYVWENPEDDGEEDDNEDGEGNAPDSIQEDDDGAAQANNAAA